jgi:hypothetical protein
MTIITNIVKSNPAQTRCIFDTQHYVIKFVSDLQQVDGFLQVLRFPPPIKFEGNALYERVPV